MSGLDWEVSGDASAGDASYALDSDLGYIRLRISDTDDSAFVFTDAELQALLDRAGDVYLAAAHAVESIAADRARLYKSRRVGDKSEEQAISELMDLAKQLRSESSQGGLQTATIADSGTGERLSEFYPSWRSLDEYVVE